MTTFFAGSPVNAGDIEAVADPSICELVQQSGQAQTGWTSATPTAITFGAGSTVVDSDSIHSESSNTSRLVIGLRLGWWQIDGLYCPATNAAQTTARTIIYKNGTAILGSFGGYGPQPASSPPFISLNTKPALLVQATAITDYVELYGYMTAASGTIGTAVSSPYVASSITAKWVRA